MKKKLFISILFFSNILSAIVELPSDSILSKCKPYPALSISGEQPSSFEVTNNLTHPGDNAFYHAEGEKIILFGRVMDKNCLPIRDAKIYIWQNNAKGYAQYPTSSNTKPKWVDPNFVGTGIANTDNLGRFDFVTIMPGVKGKTTPHINIKIEVNDSKPFTSKVYFISIDDNKIIDNVVISKPEKIAQVSFAKADKNAKNFPTYFIDITLDHAVGGKGY